MASSGEDDPQWTPEMRKYMTFMYHEMEQKFKQMYNELDSKIDKKDSNFNGPRGDAPKVDGNLGSIR